MIKYLVEHEVDTIKENKNSETSLFLVYWSGNEYEIFSSRINKENSWHVDVK